MKKLYIRPLLIELFLNKIVGFFNGSSSTHNVEHFAKKKTLKLDEIGKMLKIPPFAVPFMSKTVIVT
jgi:hypothetical protein